MNITTVGHIPPDEFNKRIRSTFPDSKKVKTFGLNLDGGDWHKLYKKTDGKCGYCGCKITKRNRTIDHIQPKSKGGNNSMKNLVLACLECNRAKADKLIQPKFIIK